MEIKKIKSGKVNFFYEVIYNGKKFIVQQNKKSLDLKINYAITWNNKSKNDFIDYTLEEQEIVINKIKEL